MTVATVPPKDTLPLGGAIDATLEDTTRRATSVADTVSAAEPGPSFTLAPGAQLGRYVIQATLGSGGMGVVYAAHDPELDRPIAIKVLRGAEGAMGGSAGRTRLLREAQAMARLRHPNVVAVHDVGTFGDEVFVAMELVDGASLASWLEAGHAWREVLDVFLAAGRGLEAAHRAGLVHRDFKPQNVLVGLDGRVLVADFGLARQLDAPLHETPTPAPSGMLASPLTRAGDVLGTPAYMSPEQHGGRSADERSDQFAFCASLWESLYGERPYPGETLGELSAAFAAGKLRPPRRERGVPPRISRVLARGLATDPGARHASMRELLAALGRDPARRRRRLALAGVTLVLVGASAGVALHFRARAAVCKGAERHLEGVWDGTRRAAVDHAFRATGKPYAERARADATARLDGYARSWALAHTAACEATRLHGEQSEEALDLRMACLDSRKQELGATVELLSSADARVVERATGVVAGMTPLAPCGNVPALRQVGLPPPEPAIQARTEDLRKRLWAVAPLARAGKFKVALEAVRKLEPEIMANGWKPLEAEFLLLRGKMEENTGDAKAAQRTFEEAARRAEIARADRTRAQAQASLTSSLGRNDDHYQEAERAARAGLATVERIGGDAGLEADLRFELGFVLYASGRIPLARPEMERARELYVRAYGEHDHRLADADAGLGLMLMEAGLVDDAERFYARALTQREQLFGPDHPRTGLSENDMGNLLDTRGRPAEARPHYEKALAIQERALGPEHPDVAGTLHNLAIVVAKAGELERAALLDQRALLIFEKRLGPENPNVATVLEELGHTAARRGRLAEADVLVARSLAIRVKVLGADHPDVALSRLSIAELARKRGQGARALKACEQALATFERAMGPTSPRLVDPLVCIAELELDGKAAKLALTTAERAAALRRTDIDPVTGARLGFALARGLWQTGGDKARARGLAVAAQRAFEAAHDEGGAAVAKWRREHP